MKRFLVAAVLVALPAAADPPQPSEYTITCKPVESSIHLGSRYFVKCDTPWKNPSTNATASSFAIGVSDDAQVRQAMEIVDTAIEAGKKIRVKFKKDATGTPAGCDGDCRQMTAVAVLNP